MKRLREKLNSQHGASILLALLFFLLCMMVAASILMAAVSNAGKIRSNYEEQQKYLALSSALRLICGEMEKAEYQGNYAVIRWVETSLDEEGNEIHINRYRIRQQRGSFSCGALASQSGDAAESSWIKVIPLLEELDDIFGEEASGLLHDSLYDPANPVPSKNHTLTFTVDATSPFGGTDLKKELSGITITIQMNRSRRIHLTATLKDQAGKLYSMEAELTAVGAPTVDFTPGIDEYPGDSPPASGGTSGINSLPGTLSPTPPVKWELSRITKKEAGGEEAGG